MQSILPIKQVVRRQARVEQRELHSTSGRTITQVTAVGNGRGRILVARDGEVVVDVKWSAEQR